MQASGKSIARFLGVALFLLVLAAPSPEGLSPEGKRVLAVASLMVVWWITEAVPIPVTSLLPLVLFPWFGVLKTGAAAAPYADKNIFLFLGGFLIALAMQRWNLHKRLALNLIIRVGASPTRLLAGFMIATGFISMWISNTATTMMMMPIGLAVAMQMNDPENRFGTPLMLGIAYSASVGGLATLVGTPPNLVLKGGLEKLFPAAPEISFLQWMALGVPLGLVMGIAVFFLLVIMYRINRFTGFAATGKQELADELKSLGPLNRGEKWTLLVFSLTALAWLTRRGIDFGGFSIPGWSALIPSSHADDSTVAMTAGLLLFLLPVDREKGRFVLTWKDTAGIPFGVLFLFGGGFCLAEGFRASGLSAWATSRLEILSGVPPLGAVAVIALVTTFLTELTSNTATASLLVPLLASLSTALSVHPLLLLLPATFSASCAFMLPVATPPNAVVFGSGLVSIRQMARTGLLLNLLGVLVVTAVVMLLGPVILGQSFGVVPAWAIGH